MMQYKKYPNLLKEFCNKNSRENGNFKFEKFTKISATLFFVFIIFLLDLPSVFSAFSVYDNFDDNYLDVAKWTKIDNGSNVNELNSRLEIAGNGSNWNQNGIISKNTITRTDGEQVQVDVYVSTGSRMIITLAQNKDSLTWSATNAMTVYFIGGDVKYKDGLGSMVDSGINYSNNTWYTLTYEFKIGSGFIISLDSTEIYNAAGQTAPTYYFQAQTLPIVANYIDNVRFNEPVVTIPSAPTELMASMGYSQASLTWTAPVYNGFPVTDYVILYKKAGGTFVVFNDGVSINTSVNIPGLEKNTKYDFRVFAINSLGNGTLSDFATVAYDNFDNNSIDMLKWTEIDAGTNITEQNSRLELMGNGAWNKNGVISKNFVSRIADDIVKADVYITSGKRLIIGLVQNKKNLTFSGSGIISVYFIGGNVLYSDNTTGAITTDSGVNYSNNTWYTIFFEFKSGGGFNVFMIPRGVTPTQISTIYNGGSQNKPTYYFMAQANDTGETNHIDNVVFTTSSITAPNVPTNVSVTPGDEQVALLWTTPSDNGYTISDYVVEYKTGQDAFTVFADGVSASPSTIVTGLTNGLTYSFRVSASNSTGTGSVSSVITGVPFTNVATAPSATSVNISGVPTVGQVLTGNYMYYDADGSTEGVSIFRWFSSDLANGNYTAITEVTSSSASYTLTSNELNKYIKFEVTPISSVAPLDGNAIMSPSTIKIGNDLYLHHILSTGQSLSLGSGGNPPLTTMQPYSNKKLSGSSLVNLIENNVESMSSSMGNFITSKVAGNNYQDAVTMHGVAGYSYEQLKKGTSPYSNGMTQVVDVRSGALASGTNYRVIGVTSIHGEQDNILNTTAAQYEADLVEWQHDYETDIQAVTGQSEPVPLFIDQMNSYTYYNDTTSAIPIAQFSASENNPGKIILIGPKYFLDYNDVVGSHLINTSYRWLGEYFGKVIKKIVDGESWKPLSPKSIVRNSDIIYAQFYVPVLPIQFDITQILAQPNYGFEYYDDNSSAYIIKVEIFSADTIKITLNSTPTGSNQRLRYAYTGVAGSYPGDRNSGSAKGNLRDSDMTQSQYGNNLYNWAVTFDKAITVQ
ncbi:MAG: fibronectin type III domain-containing protein [Candidatus Yanofskybacteria bacterium]|nr:fibronectin type III domain-containing protein [Candidatus Yanofskybacteria bacterium]